MRCADCRDAINAYVDQELLPDEQRDVRDHLASCADCQHEHDVLVATTRTLQEGLERHRAPDVLKARIRSAIARPDGTDSSDASAPRVLPRLPWARLAAAGALIAVASSALTFAAVRQQVQAPSVGNGILSSHIRSLMPGHLVDIASTDQHNVKPWFNGRLDVSPAVPRLDSLGFPLLGGRLDYVENRPVAVVVYGRRQHIINVFSWPAGTAAALAPSTSTERGYHLVHWRRDGLELWAVSDLNLPELQQFVSTFERQ
jgi:anti-sigma factor RsiW